MDTRFQVKQYVAVVQGQIGKFMVFQTGDQKFYLFAQIKDGCLTGLNFPIEKRRLRNNVRSALAHGWGNSSL